MFNAFVLMGHKSALLLFVIFCIIALAPCTIYGAGFVDINHGEVSVEKGKQEYTEAFKQVIVKMTGSKQSLSNPSVASAIRNARDFILSYEYFALDSLHSTSMYSNMDSSPSRWYRAVFDRQKIELLLRQEGLPIWGPRRPDAVIWIAEKVNDQVHIVGNEKSDAAHFIERFSNGRGVQILLPLMDLDDRLLVSERDIWARFLPVIELASNRYDTDYTIVARIIKADELRASRVVEEKLKQKNNIRMFSPLPGSRAFDRDALSLEQTLKNAEYLATPADSDESKLEIKDKAIIPESAKLVLEWLIKGNSQLYSGRFFGSDKSQLISSFIDHYADLLGHQYAIIPNIQATSHPVLSVSNIQSLHDINEINRYLNDLTVVESASLKGIEGKVASFDVTLIGGVTDFTNTIALDKRLVAVEGDNEFDAESVKLDYFWQR